MEREKILLVEDEKDMVEVMKMNLEDEGYEVFVASDGEEATTRISEKNPDLLILDIMLPNKSGWEVLSYISSVPDLQNMRVIVVTARGDETARLLGFKLGADDYLIKPFSMKELCARVKRQLERKHELEEAAATRSNLQKIPVFEGREIVLIDQRDIVYVDAIRNYSYVCTREEKFLTNMKLYQLEKRLGGFFMRIHRGYIVNLHFVEKFFSLSAHAHRVKMKDAKGTELPVSKRNVRRLKDHLKSVTFT